MRPSGLGGRAGPGTCARATDARPSTTARAEMRSIRRGKVDAGPEASQSRRGACAVSAPIRLTRGGLPGRIVATIPPSTPRSGAEIDVDRDLSAFLVQLSIAIHKSATYPPRHPLAAAAVDVAFKSLTEVLRQRTILSMGVARTQIIIDGEGTEADHPVLRELAQRLYRCQLGGITFSLGVDADELTGILRAINGEPSALAAADPGTWPHVRLHALAFDQLQLADDSDRGEPREGGKLSRLWTDLAGSALGLTGEGAEGPPADPRALAAAINARAREPAYAQAVTRQ